MKHLSDTGKQIQDHMSRTHGGLPAPDPLERKRDMQEELYEVEERPVHPIAAMGAGTMGFVALMTALVLTPLFFISVLFAIPAAIVAATGLGIWAFWSWEKRRQADAPGPNGASV